MNNALPANAPTLPDRCRVAEFAADARQMIDVFDFLDARRDIEDGNLKEAAVENMRSGVAEAATLFPARTAVGAIFHLGLIWDACDSIRSELHPDKQVDLRELSNAVRRMCESVANFISQDEAVRRAGCADYYLSSKGHHSFIAAAVDQASREERA